MTPKDCVPSTDKMVMEIAGGPDGMGRCSFFLYWHGLVGPRMDTPGVRGQAFFAQPSQHMQRVERVVDRRSQEQKNAHPFHAPA